MYMGTAGAAGTGVLKYFDATLANDDGTTFAPRLSSPPFRTAREAIIEEVRIWATQTSGTNAWTAARRLINGNYDTAVDFRLATSGAAAVPGAQLDCYRATFSGTVPSQYVNGFRITMPTDGVGSKIHKIAFKLKEGGA